MFDNETQTEQNKDRSMAESQIIIDLRDNMSTSTTTELLKKHENEIRDKKGKKKHRGKKNFYQNVIEEEDERGSEFEADKESYESMGLPKPENEVDELLEFARHLEDKGDIPPISTNPNNEWMQV